MTIETTGLSLSECLSGKPCNTPPTECDPGTGTHYIAVPETFRTGSAGLASHPAPRWDGLLDGFSIEVTPGAAAKVASFAALLPPGTAVYVTHFPGTDTSAALALCGRLSAEGLRPIPHLAARNLGSRAALTDWLARAVEQAGVRSVLLIAGAANRPAGPFRDTRDVLDSGLLERAGLQGLGVAGHPEGHPNARAPALTEALLHKQAWARAAGLDAWIVTQFTFSAAPVTRWLARLAEAGVTLTARIGLAGPARPSTLITYARQCGVGASLRVLTRRPDVMTGLLRTWTPDGLVDDLSTAGATNLAGLHLFPFGGLARAADWARTRRAEAPAPASRVIA